MSTNIFLLQKKITFFVFFFLHFRVLKNCSIVLTKIGKIRLSELNSYAKVYEYPNIFFRFNFKLRKKNILHMDSDLSSAQGPKTKKWWHSGNNLQTVKTFSRSSRSNINRELKTSLKSRYLLIKCEPSVAIQVHR